MILSGWAAMSVRRLSPLPRRTLHAIRQLAAAWSQAGCGLVGRLPAERSPLEVGSKLASGQEFAQSAALPFEERYRAYVGVFRRSRGASPVDQSAPRMDAIVDALRDAGADDPLHACSRSTRTRSFRTTVDADRQDDDGGSLECRVPLLDHELSSWPRRSGSGQVAGES